MTVSPQITSPRRGLRRYAGVASLWALGVGAVISGHYSGWNLGLMAGGWGGFALAAARHRGHVSRACLLHRRNGRGAAAYRRRLFLCPRLDGTVGRLHHRALRERRVRADARRRGVVSRDLSRRRVRHAARLAAGLLGRRLRGVRRPERLRRGAFVSRDGDRHPGGPGLPRRVLDLGPAGGAVRPLCAQHRRRTGRRGRRAAAGRWPLAAVRAEGRVHGPALRRLAVPRHRAAAAGGGGSRPIPAATCRAASSPAC